MDKIQECKTVPSLKEFLEVRIDALEKITDERFTSSQTALELGAKETERRLDILNGEAERLRLIQATYLPREVYEANFKEITKELNDLRDFKSNLQGRQAIVMVIISTSVSTLLVLIAHFLHF